MRKHPFLWGLFFLCFLALFFNAFSGVFADLIGDHKEKIAVVEVKGIITESSKVVKRLKKYGRDNSVKGILLRINSPGGGVAPSQEIYSEVLRVRKKEGKPVVASLASLGASGGYYIACAADTIFANPGSITGSLGVLMPLSNIQALLKKLGLKAVIIKSGKFKDIGSPTHEMTGEERNILQASVDDVHDQFIEAVAAARKMPVNRVRTLADGRIYTGRQALKEGLVDRLGGFEDAMRLLAERAGIQGEPKIVYEKEERGLLYRLIRGNAESLVGKGFFQSFSGFQYLWQ